MQPYRQVTDEEWGRVELLIPELKFNPTRDPRGRPMTSRRDCLNATIWVMYSGASWQTLPRKYPSYQTCHRSFKAWYDAGVIHKIAHTLFGQAAEGFLEIVSARIRTGTRESYPGPAAKHDVRSLKVARRIRTSNAVEGSEVGRTVQAIKVAGQKALKSGGAINPGTRGAANVGRLVG